MNYNKLKKDIERLQLEISKSLIVNVKVENGSIKVIGATEYEKRKKKHN